MTWFSFWRTDQASSNASQWAPSNGVDRWLRNYAQVCVNQWQIGSLWEKFLLTHWSVRQKIYCSSSVQLRRSVVYSP